MDKMVLMTLIVTANNVSRFEVSKHETVSRDMMFFWRSGNWRFQTRNSLFPWRLTCSIIIQVEWFIVDIDVLHVCGRIDADIVITLCHGVCWFPICSSSGIVWMVTTGAPSRTPNPVWTIFPDKPLVPSPDGDPQNHRQHDEDDPYITLAWEKSSRKRKQISHFPLVFLITLGRQIHFLPVNFANLYYKLLCCLVKRWGREGETCLLAMNLRCKDGQNNVSTLSSMLPKRSATL